MAKASRALLQAKAALAAAQGEIDDYKLRIKDLEQHIGGLQEAVDERNEQLHTAALERDTLQGVLDEATKQNADLGQQLVDQGEKITAMNKDIADMCRLTEDHRKAREQAEANNNFLRDSMHELTIAKARLEGQLDRVREFDPVTDQQAHRDGLDAVAQRRSSRWYDGAAMTATTQPWYRRG